LVDGAPKAVKEKISKAEAEDIAAKLKEAGADVEVK
jgi:large subunit ribosomal protein L7/L12